MDAIAEVVGPEARQVLLAREAKVTPHEVKQLADIAQVSPSLAQRVVMDVQRVKTPRPRSSRWCRRPSRAYRSRSPRVAAATWLRRRTAGDSRSLCLDA